MEFLKFILKVFFILVNVILMAAPFALEFYTFRCDKRNKITYKRLVVLVYTGVYVVGVTVLLYLLKDLVQGLESAPYVEWLTKKVSSKPVFDYCRKVLVAMLVNFGIGILYVFFSKFARVGMKSKDLITPNNFNGEFTRSQLRERKAIRFFHKEIWFFTGRIFKCFGIVLSSVYALMFILYQIPCVFGTASGLYGTVSTLFEAGYIYPTISLLAVWEAYFFLEGVRFLGAECPGLLSDGSKAPEKKVIDLEKVDEAVRTQFKDYYACDVDMSGLLQDEAESVKHNEVSELIGRAVENDRRNPHKNKEIYLSCLDKIVETDRSVLINGSFFSEFSMYFLRYLSLVVARGDNVVFVCNSDSQIDEVYSYVKEGLSRLSSIYCEDFGSDGVDFDDPIWRIVKVSGEYDVIDEAGVDDNSILITSLAYLCSARFEQKHNNFINLLDTVIFVDTLKTVNTFNRQLAILNTRLKHITRNHALMSKNGSINKDFRVRYMSKQVRYICFDHTRTPGLDRVLKNMLAVKFESADSMRFNRETLVRCYNFECRPGEDGRSSCPQYVDADEEISALMNMAVLCLSEGARDVTIFAEDSIPYADIEESISANMGRFSVKADKSRIHLNSPCYDPDDYSVVIVMDSGDNLPAALRRYVSMVSDKPALVIVFSRPYMMRDYYISGIDGLWTNSQIERIPVEWGSKKDAAQRILVKANSGGIPVEEIFRLCSGVAQFDTYVKNRDTNGILREVLEIYGLTREEQLDLFKYFEYSSIQDFDENGVYLSEDRVLLKRQGKLYDIINGRDMVIMLTNDREITLGLPKSRLTQNYICGQHLLYNGNVYHINKIDTLAGRVYARLAVGGKNDEAYRYIQDREYRVERNPEYVEAKHLVLNRNDGDVAANDVYISVFRAPMEVITKGYFEVDPLTLAANVGKSGYHSISDDGNDELAKQTYRRYGAVSEPLYSTDSIIQKTNLVSETKGALMMSIRVSGRFGEDVDRTSILAATMLNELLRSMFPSVSDSLAVCPVLRAVPIDEESQLILQRQPQISFIGENEGASDDFELVIIEDCNTDLGVISVLMSHGADLVNILFNPIYNYLKWYLNTDNKSEYLYYGLDHEPCCFDFTSLYKLSGLLGDNKHDFKYVDAEPVPEYEVCDFCGKRCIKGKETVELADGRIMCKDCDAAPVANDENELNAHLERAKMFLEIYGITLDSDCKFCFEPSARMINKLNQNRDLIGRGSDIPLRSYVDGNTVYVESTVPSINLKELLVRELTHMWQRKHLPDLSEELAEGQIALVNIQFLRHFGENTLATLRATYYESTANISGEGYRLLVRELLENPKYKNNSFRYLLEKSGITVGTAIVSPTVRAVEEAEYGLRYKPRQTDRTDGSSITYFYYPRLPESWQKAYDVLLDAIRSHAENATVENCSFEEVSKIVDAICYDHPELFWYNTFSMCGQVVTLFYGASVQESAELQKRIDSAVSEYLAGIDDSMSAYDVVLRLHLKLIAAVDYDTIALNRQKAEGGPANDEIDRIRTICGVFLDGKAVCEGYARAMQYLLQKCGVECAELAGHTHKNSSENDPGHAWNIVKIDGDYYQLDTTWDDSSNTVQTIKINEPEFDFFCITTEEIMRTRSFDMCPIEIPVCTATRANYYYHNDLVLDSYDIKKLKSIANRAAKNRGKTFTFKCKSKDVYDLVMARLNANGSDFYEVLKSAGAINKQIRSNIYSYTYDCDIWTFTIKFKFNEA